MLDFLSLEILTITRVTKLLLCVVALIVRPRLIRLASMPWGLAFDGVLVLALANVPAIFNTASFVSFNAFTAFIFRRDRLLEPSQIIELLILWIILGFVLCLTYRLSRQLPQRPRRGFVLPLVYTLLGAVVIACTQKPDLAQYWRGPFDRYYRAVMLCDLLRNSLQAFSVSGIETYFSIYLFPLLLAARWPSSWKSLAIALLLSFFLWISHHDIYSTARFISLVTGFASYSIPFLAFGRLFPAWVLHFLWNLF